MRFCTRCGAEVASGAQPDSSQGSPQTTGPISQQYATTSPHQTTEVVPQQQTAEIKKKGSYMPAVLAVLVVVALIAGLGIGGLVYAGYKVKQKATALLNNAKPDAASPSAQKPDGPGKDQQEQSAAKPSDDSGGLLEGLSKVLGDKINGSEDDDGDPVQPVNDATPVEPCATAPLSSQAAAKIPLQPGTVITTAWGIKYGDVENRVKIDSTSPTSFVEDMATEEYKDDNNHDWKPTDYKDTVCNDDLASSNTYVTVTALHMPHLFHGVTRLRLSDKSFQEIKSTGQLDLRYLDILQLQEGVKPTYEGGVLSRVEPQDIAYSMIVNDQPVTLPAIHLTGIMKSVGKDPNPKKYRPSHSEAEIYVIDDPANPLVLLWKLKDSLFHGGKFRVEVVKIEYKVPNPINLVEKQLAEQKRAITYGIYFDFNKDTIKPESDPVLKQIVQALKDHPDWKLTVNGHTDNIGGDAYNLDLSKRRAAAVKRVLVSRFHISPDRLSTNGYGASGPIDTNDTLEGRARNRRVELTRE
ncbi:MAG: OmpA family protein [Acidobacteria bacterium]|nr:OmpA family protein [Acidobacteriota bacterium]